MKTLEQIKQSYKSDTLDGRDLQRLVRFIPESDLEYFGMELKPDAIGKHQHESLTRDSVIEQLRHDVEFGFKKALSRRGISASLMNDVVKMWNWILEEGLEHFDEYAQYGLPLLKATAIKYGFPNPIGDDDGSEDKYSTEGE